MFNERVRKWITGSIYNVNFTSWKDFTLYTPYKMWRSYKPFIWNIRDTTQGYQLQILFIKLSESTAVYEINTIHEIDIYVEPHDEESIKDWISNQEWLIV
ncbi:MAG: hypothetical protein EBU66_13190 [Bacteroidetes bacterium]|nr:hypothetical protein [bacterium]NBP65599.1 hypothetical protein [Bacteroidota bacterium]